MRGEEKTKFTGSLMMKYGKKGALKSVSGRRVLDVVQEATSGQRQLKKHPRERRGGASGRGDKCSGK